MRFSARDLSIVFTALLAAGCSSGQASVDAGTSGTSQTDSATINAIRAAALPLSGAQSDYDTLIALAARSRVVFLGEQTHGTHEFYRERARITQRLIVERGFRGIALEADWPEVERVNRYINGEPGDPGAEQSLGGFTDFPLWMWRNTDTRALIEWLRAHNASLPPERRVAIFGLDVYSLFTSADAVVAYLETVDPAAAQRARAQYGCFASHRPEAQRYGAAAGSRSCQAQAAAVLAEMRTRAATRPADPTAANALFSALRNAHSVVNAEEYFRSLYLPGISTWNVRDQRMEEAIVAMADHLSVGSPEPARIVAWAHNTHSGDARATEMAEGGELNVGQLIRQRHGNESLLIGFFTHRGTVMAAPEWDAPGRVFQLRPALAGSYADLFHTARASNFMLVLRDPSLTTPLSVPRLERAVGVVYSPSTERQSHYFLARLASQFDAAIFIDQSTALTPIR